MTDAQNDEARRLHRANPLLVPLGEYIETREDWIRILANHPIRRFDRVAATAEDRNGAIAELFSVFEPTKDAIGYVMDLQDMIRAGCRARNPLIQELRLERLRILKDRNEALGKIPWCNTPLNCKLVDGAGGLGKTHPMVRYLDLLPPTWKHDRNDEAGWIRCTQLVSLPVALQGTYRSGLIADIGEAIDKRLKTDHAGELKSIRDLGARAAHVRHVLVAHYCGVLVLDNIHLSNFTFSPHRLEMLYLIIALADTGIPLVLIGSPLALLDLLDLLQTARRLLTWEPLHLMPFSPNDVDWKDGVVPAIWRHDVMPERTPLDDNIRKIIDWHSAGFPHYASLIRAGVQRDMLRNGKRTVTAENLEKWVRTSEAMKSSSRLIAGFREKDPTALSAFKDLPWQQYGLMWGKIGLDEIVEQEGALKGVQTRKMSPSRRADLAQMSIQVKAARAFAQEHASRERRAEANDQVRRTAESADWRVGKSEEVLTPGIKALKKRVAEGR